MADEFDKQAAAYRHDGTISEARRIRDGLTRDIIDYYYNYYPSSETEEREQIAGMRQYLSLAADRINDLVNRL